MTDTVAPRPAASPPERCRWRVVLPTLSLIVFVAFAPSLGAGLVDWDDDANLKENPHFRGFDPARLAWMFSTSFEGHYQPLTWLSYAADYSIWGELPSGELVAFGFHLTNVLLHVANTLLVFLLSWRWMWWDRPVTADNSESPRPGDATQASGTGERDQSSGCPPGVLALSIVVLTWSVHPLRVESVTWATERRQLLAGMFLLLATHAWTSHVRSGRGVARSPWYVTTIGLHLLSLLASAWGITFPALLLLWDVSPFGRWSRSTSQKGQAVPQPQAWPGSLFRNRIGLVAEKLPFYAAAGLFAVIAARAQHSASAWQSVEKLDLLERLALAAHASGWYPITTLWPHPLVTLRTIPPDWGIATPSVWGSAVVTLLLLAVGLWSARQGQTGWLIAVLSYLVILAPVSGIAQSGKQLVADRYSYLSTLPLFVAIGTGLGLWLARRTSAEDAADRAALIRRASLPAGVVLMAATWWTQTAWWSSLSLWERTVRWAPQHNPLAHNNYGVSLARAGRTGEALRMYEVAHRLDPRDPMPLVNRGNVWFRSGEFDKAIVDFEAALRLKPNHFPAWVNRGLALQKLQRYPEALTCLTRALELNRDSRFVLLERSRLLVSLGKAAAGLEDYRRYLELGGGRDADVERRLRSGT